MCKRFFGDVTPELCNTELRIIILFWELCNKILDQKNKLQITEIGFPITGQEKFSEERTEGIALEHIRESWTTCFNFNTMNEERVELKRE